MVDTNLRVLQASRKRLRRGDIFAMSPGDGVFLFGRVIDTEAMMGSMVGCILIYIFKTQSAVKEAPAAAELMPGNLLLAPRMINRLPWSRGYFETIAHRDVESGEVINPHCFRAANGHYYDEKDRELPGPVEPVGNRALDSFRTIDDAVSKALGIPLAPD